MAMVKMLSILVLFFATIWAELTVPVAITSLEAQNTRILVSLSTADATQGVVPSNTSLTIDLVGIAQSNNGNTAVFCRNVSAPIMWNSVNSIGGDLTTIFGVGEYCSTIVLLQATLNVSSQLHVEVSVPVGVSSSSFTFLFHFQSNDSTSLLTPAPTLTSTPATSLNETSGSFVWDLSSLVWLRGDLLAISSSASLDANGALELPITLGSISNGFTISAEAQALTQPPPPYDHKKAAAILTALVGTTVGIAMASALFGGVLQYRRTHKDEEGEQEKEEQRKELEWEPEEKKEVEEL